MELDEAIKMVNTVNPFEWPDGVIKTFYDYLGDPKGLTNYDVALKLNKLDIPVWFAFAFGGFWVKMRYE